MEILEKELEDYLEERLESDFRLESHKHSFVNRTIKRQLNMGRYGIADLIHIGQTSSGLTIYDVIELKVVTLTPEHLAQVSRYVYALSTTDPPGEIEIYPTLIGAGITDELLYIMSHHPTVTAYIYELTFKHGIRFKKVQPMAWIPDYDYTANLHYIHDKSEPHNRQDESSL